jgi:OOP family OmpA-OmpF porin
VTLTGSYPDESSHDDILAVARRWFNDTGLVDALKPGRGAPADFVAAATATLEQLSRLGNGEGKVSDSKVSILGDALYPKAVADIEADLSAGVPKGYEASATIQVAPPAAPVDATACQALLAAILEHENITFETSSASIEKYAHPVLDALVATAMRCPDAHLEISGHTDDRGNDEMNLDLSRRRAEAVVSYLVNAGIDSARLSAAGYGHVRPIASNESEEGRAKNRRIEFQLK